MFENSIGECAKKLCVTVFRTPTACRIGMDDGLGTIISETKIFSEGALKVCPEPGSNQRHADFQSAALPTELSGRMNFWNPMGITRRDK